MIPVIPATLFSLTYSVIIEIFHQTAAFALGWSLLLNDKASFACLLEKKNG
jgi:hypothetical protein